MPDQVSTGWAVGACVDVSADTVLPIQRHRVSVGGSLDILPGPGVKQPGSGAGSAPGLSREFLRYSAAIFGISGALIVFGELASAVLP